MTVTLGSRFTGILAHLRATYADRFVTTPSWLLNAGDTGRHLACRGHPKEAQSISKKLEAEALDNLLDALVWMRRKARKRQPVDVLIDELVRMRRKAKKKAAKKKKGGRPAKGTHRN